MLDRSEWQAKAAALQPGRRARVDHLCGPGRTLLVRHDTDGSLHAWCFRCTDGGGFRPTPTLQELVQRTQALSAADAQCQRVCAGPDALPEPRVYAVDDWPPAARLWLYRAGLGRTEIALLGAAYLPAPDRVWLPLSALDKRLRYWTARAYQPGRTPKYLGASERPSVVLAYPPVVRDSWRPLARDPVLTEDALSAFKISLSGFEAWPVMGTSIPPAYIAELLSRNCGATLWLDPDPAGQRAAAKYQRQLIAYGIPVRLVRSTRDPKLHHAAEIKDYLT